jgi:hypothetical protein
MSLIERAIEAKKKRIILIMIPSRPVLDEEVMKQSIKALAEPCEPEMEISEKRPRKYWEPYFKPKRKR